MIGGDLIVAINGDPIGDQQDLANSMNKHRAGDTVTVTIYRGRRKMNVPVQSGRGARSRLNWVPGLAFRYLGDCYNRALMRHPLPVCTTVGYHS